MVTSSLIPGVATAKYWNMRLPDSRSAIGFTRICRRRYSSSAFCGSIEIVQRPSRISTSLKWLSSWWKARAMRSW
jgi:hypothetical protein